MQSRVQACILISLFLPPASCRVQAQTQTKTKVLSQASTTATVPFASQQGIKVTVRSSRPQTVAFTDFSVYADIENTSSKPIYLHPKAFTLTVPVELNPTGDDWFAIFPGCRELKDVKDEKSNIIGKEDVKCDSYDEKDRFDKVVELAPGSKTIAFWNGNTHYAGYPNRDSGLLQFASKWVYWRLSVLIDDISLPVGKYTFRIVGAYWDTKEAARITADERRRETAELDMNIVASQSTIILGAILGGLVAFFLLPNLRISEAPEKAFSRKWFRDLFAAMLLSAIVPILISRLSDAQFLVKVSVNDFWGAVVIGFVAAASGTKGLQKLAKI